LRPAPGDTAQPGYSGGWQAEPSRHLTHGV
jgi:hypothetical protein